VEVSVRLGVDPRKADQMVRARSFCRTARAKSAGAGAHQGRQGEGAQDAGADYVGSDDLIAKIQGGWLDFDVVIATPDIMGQVGKLEKSSAPAG
jgi:large subunit ribosomal protein L1